MFRGTEWDWLRFECGAGWLPRTVARNFNRNTRTQLKQVSDALRELMTPPDPPKRPIGFVGPEDKSSTKTSRARGRK